jgi:hypothetical protein
VDPGHKGTPGHITGNSIGECAARVPADAVIAGWRNGSFDAGDGNDYKNTCFYYTSQQAHTGPYYPAANHSVACMDTTKDINTGCGGPVASGKFFGDTGGWLDPGHRGTPGHIQGYSMVDCVARAPDNAKIAGWRDGTFNSGGTDDYTNTCFYYTTNKTAAELKPQGHHSVTCIDPNKNVTTGCA